MVDDSMEIASEHGHNIVEEDIDIDIDLTTGNFDEDDILDDVDADADFDTNIDDVPAQIETDDLMVDDDGDDASYHMEDADLLEEEADDHNMEQEPAGMPSTVNHPADNFFNEIHPAEPSIDDVGVSDQYWDDSQVAQPSTGAANAQGAEAIVYGSENIVDNSAVSANDSNPQDVQEFAPNLFPHSPTEKDTQPNSPQNPNSDHFNGEHLENSLNEPADAVEAIDPNTHTEDEEHLDLNTTSNESGSNPTINAEDQEQAHPDLNIASTKSGSIDPLNSTFESSKDSDNQNHAREIVVEYNNRNYPLIRKSSADHPNEYFFDDHSVVEKPFNEFCAEIRKVLMEENLPKDDKISLVIEELQLVIEETQLAYYPDDLSLGQIIRLYERLVKNDGTGEIPPLHLRLVVQPTGPDRFFALSKGAAEGKGLLEYVTWDADSEDDPTEFGEPTEHHDSESPVDEYNPELEEGERYTGASDVQDENSNTELVTNAHGEQQPHREHIESATSASAEAPQAEQGESQEEIDDQQSASAEVRQSPGKLQQPEDEVDEDGDFIDYEDEEDVEKPSKSVALKSELPETDESRPHNGRFTDFTLPCILPATCLCSSCSDLVLTECRAAEEESRRNSVSLRAENLAGDLDDQAGEDTTHASEAAQPNETSQDVESDIDYEEENADDNFNAEKQENTNENLDAEEGHGTTPNGPENVKNVNDLNDTNDEDREYTSYNDNDKIEESGDGEGFDLADQNLQASHGDYNETEQNGDGEVSDPADSSLEANNVEISFDGDIENGEEDNYGEEEFDLGVGDEEETEFLQSYQLDHDTSFHGSNDFLDMSVVQDATTTDIPFNETAAETDSATLSNASITELQGMKPSLATGQDQEDEIDYDDDDDEEDPPSPVIAPQPPTPTSKDSPVSNSGKRPRAETDFEDGDDSVISEAKRIRS
ncbi:hypothetical protein DSL72_000450 [Monilinia vaccinii-corymbosi]|uniref:Uncharacterized protein n=1 Tax=Monilinia vaccinii-corymbosi TaxID=61207 RepID=A0A8A3P1M6_9HELO|nr:hypothetical protein DSL72_000450 [Monilinia vaccinii-corymbosi]